MSIPHWDGGGHVKNVPPQPPVTDSEPGRAGRVVVLFALGREMAPFRRALRTRHDVSVIVTGVGRSAARRAAKALINEPLPRLIIMAGFCGALVPDLAVGDVVISRDICSSGSSWLAAELLVPGDIRIAARRSRILTTNRLISDPIEKKRLGKLHQADAVDMESATVAEVCARAGVPFLAGRAVSDTVETRLSPELVKLLSGGRVSPWKAAAAILRRPLLLGEFLRLARDTRRASRNLATVLVGLLGK